MVKLLLFTNNILLKADYNALKGLINTLTGYAKGLVFGVTSLMLCIYGIKYIMGDSSEKQENLSNIKTTLIMGGGIFFLLWLAKDVILKKMQ
jgi:hypothetical protein